MTTIAVFLILVAALGWLLLSGRGEAPEPTAHRSTNEQINYTELEQAEREVREAPDADSVQDWGPGTHPPQPPLAG